MVRLIATPPILSALEAIPRSAREDLELPDTLNLGNPIAHDQIIRISRYFRDKHSSKNASTSTKIEDRSFDLDSLLHGTKLYIPPPPPKPEPSPEYLALKARLLAAAESDAYNRMIQPQPTHSSNSFPTSSPDIFASSTPTLAALHDTNPNSNSEYDDPLTPSLVLNIFLSVLITGFSVYWALTSFHTPEILISKIVSMWSTPGREALHTHRGSGGASEPIRVLLSLFAALAVGVVEVAIYAIYLGKVQQAREKEKKLKERKSLLQREEVRAKGRDTDDTTTVPVPVPDKKEEEVIWGRGPNGGVRRRVRERWEEAEKKDQDQDYVG
ncbi:endoplasmic reticulum-based factor for assembly of V-ATPase-domain-containing protein [Aspergillus granulosus]|uniref:Endoplasmic reticulum-based factor for assembly of V-ATPase-domain-containing protein n=1 Tax=Aspergillus granulosus TaxID=176169 RepID=A0ABR4H2T4_9EURO